MLPRQTHIFEINRFHDKLNQIRERLNTIKDDESKKNESRDLASAYFDLSQVWSQIDDLIEMKVKLTLDSIES